MMRTRFLLAIFAIACCWTSGVMADEVPGNPAMPVPFTDVHVNDVFWSPRLEAAKTVTIPACFKKCEEHRIPNFARAGGLEPGPFVGTFYDDSDLYKIIEGAAYVLALQKDEQLDKYCDDVIAKIAAAQEEDGYLFTSRTIMQKYPQYKPVYVPRGGRERWAHQDGHELYCAGHMYEAAVAHYQATGKKNFLDVAIKNADMICNTFGLGKAQSWAPGHQEIEIGLVKLYRVTGDKKYLDQAKYFLDIRGQKEGRNHPAYGVYNQDHIPVIEQTEAVGHSVRAVYMYSGMADVAALTGDKNYIKAINAIWDDVVGSKIYVTGALGADPKYEGFGPKFDLPNDIAYCETCANIANVYWNYRMFLSTGDSQYVDVMERSLYNGVLSGIDLKGDHFFYPNVLYSPEGSDRSAWFGCSCCPSNLSRFLPSMPGYMYAVRGDCAYINLYAQSEALLKGVSVNGTPKDVKLKVETRYPWDGTVKVTVLTEGEFTVKARIPGWARGEAIPAVKGNYLYTFTNFDDKQQSTCNADGKTVTRDGGYFVLKSNWKAGDTFTLNFPMQILHVVADQRVKADNGLVAIQRGPLVFCVEQQDCTVTQTGKTVKNLRSLVLSENAQLTASFDEQLLNGVVTINGAIGQSMKDSDGKFSTRPVTIKAIPYYSWANRGHQPMTVYLAQKPETAQPIPTPILSLAQDAKASASFVSDKHPGEPEFMQDGVIPSKQQDWECQRWHSFAMEGTKGKPQWVQYDFSKPTAVKQVGLYWFDDREIGLCRVPKSWKLLYKTESGEWKEVSNPSGYNTVRWEFNKTTFDPVTTTGLRIEMESEPNFATGIYEWTVE